MYIIKLQEGCWIADWEGDPGRTIIKENAKLFHGKRKAANALIRARYYRPFRDAKIVKI